MTRVVPSLFTLLPTLLIAGCQVGDLGAGSVGGTGDDDAPAPESDGPLGAPRDPDSLPACCTDFVGGAHCLPSDIIPTDLRGILAECTDGGLCVPDPFIETGGV